MRKRNKWWLWVVAALIALCLGTCVGLGVYRGRCYTSFRQYYTLICVGRAYLLYQSEYGIGPTSVPDLLRLGLLKRSDDGEYVDTRGGSHGWRTSYADAMRVRLLDPGDASAYEWRGDTLVNKATGRAFALVDIDDPSVWPEHVEYVNSYLAKEWLKLMNGEPLPDW